MKCNCTWHPNLVKKIFRLGIQDATQPLKQSKTTEEGNLGGQDVGSKDHALAVDTRREKHVSF